VSRKNSDEGASSRTEAALTSIAAHDFRVRSFCDVRAAPARSDATALDLIPSSHRNALHGVPVAIKEVFDVAGCHCGWGTPIHADRVPDEDCVVVTRLKAAGAVVIGTTASTEYAMALAAPTGNPYSLDRTPGASSSGSAAAVAAQFVELAIGSQTIGSGIRPAAYCGVLGLKPTHGAIPLQGAMPLSAPLDHVAIMARDLSILEAAFNVLSCDASVSGTASAEVPPSRIGLLPPWFTDPVDERVWRRVRTAVDWLAGGAAATVTIPTKVRVGERECLETILAVDMWRNHAADEHAGGDAMSPQLKAWFDRGRQFGDAAYERELARREELSQAMEAVFNEHAVVASLATTGLAPLRSEGTGSRAPQRLWSLLGCPALAVPIGMIDGLPVAVQLIARPGHEWSLIALARRIASSFTMPPPQLLDGTVGPAKMALPHANPINLEITA